MLITSQCASTGRLAIRCLRPDLIPALDRARVEQEMTDLAIRLGRAVDLATVEINPSVAGPWATVANAIAHTHATDVIVPDLEHVDGIDGLIRERVQLITLEGERVLAQWAKLSTITPVAQTIDGGVLGRVFA